MKQLLFMRHGQSEANAHGVYASANPSIQLTELGRQQAVAAGQALVGRHIDVIVASPYDRAQVTARLVAEQIGYPAEQIVADDRLCELDVGKLAGQPDRGFVEYFELSLAGTNPTAETPDQITARVSAWLREADAKYADQVVLVVAHAGVARTMRAVLTGAALQSLATVTIPNAEAFELPLDRLTEVIA